ncbi:MAG: hypothetical protein ACOX5R_21140 [bacterium]|jgi:hypothetical protein
MEWIFLSLLLMCSGAGAVYYCSVANQSRYSRLLQELGLSDRLRSGETVPFYKWKWKQNESERVWAERIVCHAFEHADVWLAPEDLRYFESCCRNFAAGVSLDEEQIKSYTLGIFNRTQSIKQTTMKQAEEILQRVTSLSEAEAEALLQQKGYKTESNPLVLYTKIEIRRTLRDIGLQVLGYHSTGVEIRNAEGDPVYSIFGQKGWRYWLALFRVSCFEAFSRSYPSPWGAAFSTVSSSIPSLFQDFEADVVESVRFHDALQQEIGAKELELTLDEIEHKEQILYSWMFQNPRQFGMTNLKNLRTLLSQKNLSPHFRQILLRMIQSDISCLRKIVDLLPRRVIFYGDNAPVRTFASDMYLHHLEHLYLNLPESVKFNRQPPIMLILPESKIHQYLKTIKEQQASLPAVTEELLSHLSLESFQFNLLNLLDFEKQKILLSRTLDTLAAEQTGWIINLGSAVLTPDDLAQLEQKQYRYYARFNCDTLGTIDLKSNTPGARQQRVEFFNTILDTLLNISTEARKHALTHP